VGRPDHLCALLGAVRANHPTACHGLTNQANRHGFDLPHCSSMLPAGDECFQVVTQLPGGELIAFEIGCHPALAIDY
jgi:hypothetical protein